jgi:hypothetical protein
VENGSKILYQCTKVHTAIGSEEKGGLVPFKVAFHIHKLHVQLVLKDFFFADGHGALFALPVELIRTQIHLRGDSQNTAQRLHDGVIVNQMVFHTAGGNFHTVRGIHNNNISGVKLKTAWVKKIGFPPVFEFNTDNFGHT